MKKYKIKVYENILDGSEHFVLVKGLLKKVLFLALELYPQM